MMLRFILKRTVYDAHNRFRQERFETIDDDMQALSAALRSGGYGPQGYDKTELVGVELLTEEVPS